MAKYLVYGTGKSGICAAGLLRRQNEDFILFDENVDLNVEKIFENNPEFEKTIPVKLGNLDDETIRSLDYAVISPGVPLEHENVKKLIDGGVEILGELELGFRYEKGSVIAITGTNGKTTTTSLVGHICKLSGRETFVAGNIGDPYTAVCDSTSADSVTVLEVSSFQLETVKKFAPKISAILNITPDHLDRHKTFENYANIKLSVADRTDEQGVCVLNYDDKLLKEYGEANNKNIVYFSSKHTLPHGLFLDGRSIYMEFGKGVESVVDVKDLKILGTHNYENAMAAIAICFSFGIKMKDIREGLKTFNAVEHRIEFVCEKLGVAYYNDSKGTNPDAAIKAVKAMERPIILIGGGYNKNADYTEWIESFNGKVRHLILIGDSARDIARCCENNNFRDYSFEDTFESAVNSAMNWANKGDCVLLSPACASWGMFSNFEERGNLFKELVRK